MKKQSTSIALHLTAFLPLLIGCFLIALETASAEISSCQNLITPTTERAPANGNIQLPVLQFTDCDTENVTLKAGDGSENTAIGQEGYYWNGDNWHAFAFRTADDALNGTWNKGNAEIVLPKSTTQPMFAAVSFICQRQEEKWNCGCDTDSCDSQKWSLQVVRLKLEEITHTAADECSPKTIVVLGSSTPAGYGPSPISNSWVNLYAAALKKRNPEHRVINFAVGGFNTYHILPTETVPPEGRPFPATENNITAALALKPDAIIVNMPTNDIASGFTLAEIQENYGKIKAEADRTGVPIWFTTTQPRGISMPGILEEFPPEDLKKRDRLIALKDWTNMVYGSKSLDYWTTIANENDGLIEMEYTAGDGIHLNNAGHRILFERVENSGLLEEICEKGA